MTAFVEYSRKLNITDITREAKSEMLGQLVRAKIETTNQVIFLTTTPCHFGGHRFWFLCPTFRKRAGTLYQTEDGRGFFCRGCQGLTYLKSRYHKMV